MTMRTAMIKTLNTSAYTGHQHNNNKHRQWGVVVKAFSKDDQNIPLLWQYFPHLCAVPGKAAPCNHANHVAEQGKRKDLEVTIVAR